MTTKLKEIYEEKIEELLKANTKDEIRHIVCRLVNLGVVSGLNQFDRQIRKIRGNFLFAYEVDFKRLELEKELFAVYCEDMDNSDLNLSTADVVKLFTNEENAKEYIKKEKAKPEYKSLFFLYKKMEVE